MSIFSGLSEGGWVREMGKAYAVKKRLHSGAVPVEGQEVVPLLWDRRDRGERAGQKTTRYVRVLEIDTTDFHFRSAPTTVLSFSL